MFSSYAALPGMDVVQQAVPGSTPASPGELMIIYLWVAAADSDGGGLQAESRSQRRARVAATATRSRLVKDWAWAAAHHRYSKLHPPALRPLT